MHKRILIILITIDFLLFCSGIYLLISRTNLTKGLNIFQNTQTNNSAIKDEDSSKTSDSNDNTTTDNNGSTNDNGTDSNSDTPTTPTPTTPTPTPPTPIPTPDIATSVAINEKKLGTKIPTDFLGLSTSYSVVTDGKLATSDLGFINLLDNLGPGVFRFVGDYNYWLIFPDPTVCTPLNSSSQGYLLTSENVKNLFTFMNLTNWKVIFGLNIGCYNPTRTAYEAAVVSQLGGSSLLAFEIGNEPNGFLAVADYIKEFEVYNKDILARTPNLEIVAPATVNATTFFKTFLSSDSTNIQFATYHLYPQGHANATMDNMLSLDMATKTATQIKTVVDSASTYGKKVRYAEMNSVSGGGKVGVSDTFASALWSVDTMLTMAEDGVIGVNIHGGGCGGYSAVGFCPTRVPDQAYRYQAFPLYYGLLLFHLAAQGKPAEVSFDSTINMGVHAVLADDGTLRVVIVNRDGTKSVGTTINTSGTYSSASLIRLTSTSLTETKISNITLGGNSVTTDGKWSSNTGETLTKSGSGNYSVFVPAGSAILVTFTK